MERRHFIISLLHFPIIMCINAIFCFCFVSFQPRYRTQFFLLNPCLTLPPISCAELYIQAWNTNSAVEFMEAWDMKIYYHNIKASNWKSNVLIIKGALATPPHAYFQWQLHIGPQPHIFSSAPPLLSHLNLSSPPLSG